jgi:curved DNA-binding protein CbpA
MRKPIVPVVKASVPDKLLNCYAVKNLSMNFMNAFHSFGLEPSPCVDQEDLKKRFLASSATLHPDIGGSRTAQAFSDLNQAYQLLSSDRLRLKHLLEICGLSDPGSIGAVPGNLGDLFMKAGGLLNTANTLIKAQKGIESVLEGAAWHAEALVLVEKLQELLEDLFSLRQTLRERWNLLGESWENNQQNLQLLKVIYLELSYVEKWIEQLQEKIFLLSEHA